MKAKEFSDAVEVKAGPWEVQTGRLGPRCVLPRSKPLRAPHFPQDSQVVSVSYT